MSLQMKNELEPDLHVNSYSDEEVEREGLLKNARNGFIKKVYSILSIQLLMTVLFVAANMHSPAFHQFQRDNWGLYIFCAVVTIVSMIIICCCRTFSKRTPNNYILLLIFTLAQSYMVSVFCSFYQPSSVMLAAAATLAATLGLTLYAVTTKVDFTECAHYLYGFFWSFLLLTITLVVINIIFIGSSWMETLIAVLIASIYSLYLIIDTQLIIGGRHIELSLDDYVLGAILLYVDIITLFIEILRIIGKKD